MSGSVALRSRRKLTSSDTDDGRLAAKRSELPAADYKNKISCANNGHNMHDNKQHMMKSHFMQLKLVPNSHQIMNALTVSNHSSAAILITSN